MGVCIFSPPSMLPVDLVLLCHLVATSSPLSELIKLMTFPYVELLLVIFLHHPLPFLHLQLDIEGLNFSNVIVDLNNVSHQIHSVAAFGSIDSAITQVLLHSHF